MKNSANRIAVLGISSGNKKHSTVMFGEPTLNYYRYPYPTKCVYKETCHSHFIKQIIAARFVFRAVQLSNRRQKADVVMLSASTPPRQPSCEA
jgi:Tat protein secretion system quality control protein TatD with DNase activity